MTFQTKKEIIKRVSLLTEAKKDTMWKHDPDPAEWQRLKGIVEALNWVMRVLTKDESEDPAWLKSEGRRMW